MYNTGLRITACFVYQQAASEYGYNVVAQQVPSQEEL